MSSTLPTLNAGGVVTFIGGTSQVALDPALTLAFGSSDPNDPNQPTGDGPTLAGASVSIGAGFTAGDTLNFTSQNGITGSYDAASGVLTLSGSTSTANYQAALRSVTYSFSPSTADPTEGQTDNARVISWSITDGTSGTQQINAIGGGYDAPVFLAVDGNGTVFVTDDGNAPNLTALALINGSYVHPPTPLPNLPGVPAGIAVDGGGNLFIASNAGPGLAFSEGLEVFAPTYQTRNPFFTPATTDVFVGMAVDALGNVFIVDQSAGTITEVNGANFANHTTVFAASPLLMTQGLKLEGIAVDAHGNLFVAEHASGAGDIRELTAASGYQTSISLGFGSLTAPTGVAVDAHGNLFVTDSFGNNVVDQTVKELLGPNYATVITIDNTHFLHPTGIAVDARGDIFVADTGHHAVAEITALPTSMVNIAIAPVVSAGASVTFTYANNGAPIALDAGLTVSDQASQNLVGATVSIAAGFVGGDTLNFSNQNGITGSYDAVHGVLSLSGSASVGFYQQALQSITYSYTGPVTGNGARTIDWVVKDGAATSNTATSALDVELPPPSVAVGSFTTPSFTGGGAPVVLDNVLTVADPVSATLFGATVSIAAGFLAGDQLNFSSQNGITGQYDAVHGVLSLSSATGVSLTDFQAALHTITYSFNPANGDPTGGGDTIRAINWTVNDGGHTSSPGTTLLTTVHAPPTVSIAGAPTFTKGFGPILLAPSASVADPDSGGSLARATVQLTGGTFSGDGDVLAATTTGTLIAASYDSLSETLTLSGTDTLAHYSQVLQSVTFSSTSSDPTHGGADAGRMVTWTVDDGNASNHVATATQSVDVVAPPTITAGASATFTGGATHVVLDPGLSLHDTESATLTGATVDITAGFTAGDTLNFTNQNGITGHYDAAHGVLTLSGTATLAQYQAALQSVSYSFTPTASDPTGSGTNASRVITWTVDDGISTNMPIASIGSGYLQPDSVAVDANGTVYVTDAGNGNVTALPLVNGVYAFTPALLASLALPAGIIVGQGGALWIADTTVRELLPPTYATALAPNGLTGFLHGIAQDTSGNIFVADENNGVSELLASTGYGSAIPILQTGNFPTALALDAHNNLFVFTVGNSLLREFTAASGYATPISIATFPSQVTGLAFDAHGDLFAATQFDGIIELYGPGYSTSVTINAPFADNAHGIAFDAAGDMFVTLRDQGLVQKMLAPTVSTLDIVLSPVVTAGATATFTGGGGPVALDPALTVADQGSTTLTGATVAIAAGFLAGDTLNFSDQNGIHGVYDAVHGVLTLTGTASLAFYQAALDSISYAFSPANGDATAGGADASRAIGWSATDGTHSGSGTSTLTIVHTAPSIVVTAAPAFIQGGPAVTLDGALTVADPDSNGMLTRATVKIVGGTFSGDGDTLDATTAGTSIGASYDSVSETLTLLGSDTLAHYGQVLESVTYKSTSGDPTHGGADPGRTIVWTVDDGNSANHLGSATQSLTVVPLVQFTSPSIIGLAQTGQTLTAPAVGGSGTPSYTWLSSADGFTHAIGIGPTYLVQRSDEAHTIEVSASVIIGGVTQTITSLPTDTVVDAPPIVTMPAIAGLEQAGHTLTASATGNNTLTYQWFSSADGFAHAIGSGANYLVQPADASHTLEVTATVTNDNGITASASAVVPTHLDGTIGNDTFTATAGNEFIIGHGGTDTVSFNFKLTDAQISFVGNEVIVDTVSSHTILNGMSVYQFTDGTVNEKATSDLLVDPLFYYSQYHDVWTAGLDAATQYNTVGWHQGRDPDAFFSTSTYLSLNPAVKASGVDPLTQFEQGGWKTSDPSINFDINAYLKANPDVAVAGIDPLVQYLVFGEAEGRQPIAPNTLVAQNGFDYVYYLQHNPDVAAAHVDPFQHYETVGWKEGRNPNAYFDTAGYLAHNPDVAASGMNPLDHYDNFGWKEGRNPSTLFDTTDYLAAYQDVAAAHIDPLVQFLAHGLAEGRTPHGDGMWT